MKLSSRLQAIADFVPANTIVADIGTDHGYIPVYLIEENICKLVIGTDISKGSLDKIIEFIKVRNLEGKVIPRLGDGLKTIKPFEVDTVIIAGMGGLLIQDILQGNKVVAQSIDNFILQPMIATKELRAYLISNKFQIIDEKLIKEDNKFYEIIYAKRGLSYLEKEIDLEISPIHIKSKHPLLKEFIESKMSQIMGIMEELKDKSSDKSEMRYKELGIKLEEYKEVLKDIEG